MTACDLNYFSLLEYKWAKLYFSPPRFSKSQRETSGGCSSWRTLLQADANSDGCRGSGWSRPRRPALLLHRSHLHGHNQLHTSWTVVQIYTPSSWSGDSGQEPTASSTACKIKPSKMATALHVMGHTWCTLFHLDSSPSWNSLRLCVTLSSKCCKILSQAVKTEHILNM